MKRQGGGGGASVKESKGRKPSGLATGCYHRGAPGVLPWGVGRVKVSGILLSESAYFLCRSALAGKSQPVRHQQGGWVGCVLTPCLWLIEKKKSCVFSGKSVRVLVLTFTPFSKIQSYIYNHKHWKNDLPIFRLYSTKTSSGQLTKRYKPLQDIR